MSWRVEGLQHAELSAGTRNPDGSWTVTEAEAQGLKVLHSDPQTLHVTAVATDAGTGATAGSQPVDVTVDPAGAHYTVITGSPMARTDEDATAPVTGDFNIDTDKVAPPTFVPDTQSTPYGTFTIDADGRWSFTVDNAAAQPLVANSTEHFTVATADGATKSLEVVIAGDNDAGDLSFASQQPATASAPVIGGQLAVTDPDTPINEYYFTLPRTGGQQPVNQGHTQGLDGHYGRFTLDLMHGSWTYTPDPAKLAQLPAGQTSVETVTTDAIAPSVHSKSNTLDLHIQVDGSGNAHVVVGGDSGSVTEDQNVQAGELVTTGTLAGVSASDPLPTTHVQGSHGTFALTADGGWTYTAHNADTAIQGLHTGDKMTDHVSVTTAGGNTYELSVEIHGTDDGPKVQHGDLGSTPEGQDKTFTVADLIQAVHATGDSGDTLTVASVSVDAQYGTFTKTAGGDWAFHPAAGVSHDDVPVSVVVKDSTGATQTAQAHLDVTAVSQATGAPSQHDEPDHGQVETIAIVPMTEETAAESNTRPCGGPVCRALTGARPHRRRALGPGFRDDRRSRVQHAIRSCFRI